MVEYLLFADSYAAALRLLEHIEELLDRPCLARTPDKGCWEPAHVCDEHLGLTIDTLKRDLRWWADVPSAKNGRSIFRPMESAYLHFDSSRYGWGVVPNDKANARGYWRSPDLTEHITVKELKALRLAELSFLFLMRGCHVLLHDHNQAFMAELNHLISRSPATMAERRKLWELPRYDSKWRDPV
eukprot:jgi/Tetstr1/456051/TSEL_042821.t1